MTVLCWDINLLVWGVRLKNPFQNAPTSCTFRKIFEVLKNAGIFIVRADMLGNQFCHIYSKVILLLS